MLIYSCSINADVAKLADALDLGSSVFDMGVQVLSSAPTTYLFELLGTDRYKNQSENKIWLIFLFIKNLPTGKEDYFYG